VLWELLPLPITHTGVCRREEGALGRGCVCKASWSEEEMLTLEKRRGKDISLARELCFERDACDVADVLQEEEVGPEKRLEGRDHVRHSGVDTEDSEAADAGRADKGATPVEAVLEEATEGVGGARSLGALDTISHENSYSEYWFQVCAQLCTV
jgi:hypothetical protein